MPSACGKRRELLDSLHVEVQVRVDLAIQQGAAHIRRRVLVVGDNVEGVAPVGRVRSVNAEVSRVSNDTNFGRFNFLTINDTLILLTLDKRLKIALDSISAFFNLMEAFDLGRVEIAHFLVHVLNEVCTRLNLHGFLDV